MEEEKVPWLRRESGIRSFVFHSLTVERIAGGGRGYERHDRSAGIFSPRPYIQQDSPHRAREGVALPSSYCSFTILSVTSFAEISTIGMPMPGYVPWPEKYSPGKSCETLCGRK